MNVYEGLGYAKGTMNIAIVDISVLEYAITNFNMSKDAILKDLKEIREKIAKDLKKVDTEVEY